MAKPVSSAEGPDPATAPTSLSPLRWGATHVEEVVCAIMLAVMVVAVTAGVTFRYVFNAPLSWPEELSRFALVWLTFVGAALATKRQGHIVLDFLVHFLPERMKLRVALAVQAGLILFMVAFTWLSLQVMQKASAGISAALSLNMGLVYLALPLGSCLMILHMTREAMRTARACLAARRP